MLHDILQTFKGSQTGSTTELFEAGTRAELSDSLAEVAVREGWAKPVAPVQDPLPAVDGAAGASADRAAEPRAPRGRRK